MKGSATITTTTTVTPVYVTEVRNAEVVQASASSIIVRGQNGFQMYTEGDVEKRGIKIFKNGRPVSFSDLHTRDKLTATIVTEGPPKVVTEREVQARLSSPPPPSSAGAAETARAAEPARAANPPVASPPPPPAQPPAAVATPPASAPVAAPSSASPTREAG
jgi:dihydroorotase-like cyclic amidohydrolase